MAISVLHSDVRNGRSAFRYALSIKLNMYLTGQPRGVLVPDPSLAERGNTYDYI